MRVGDHTNGRLRALAGPSFYGLPEVNPTAPVTASRTTTRWRRGSKGDGVIPGSCGGPLIAHLPSKVISQIAPFMESAAFIDTPYARSLSRSLSASMSSAWVILGGSCAGRTCPSPFVAYLSAAAIAACSLIAAPARGLDAVVVGGGTVSVGATTIGAGLHADRIIASTVAISPPTKLYRRVACIENLCFNCLRVISRTVISLRKRDYGLRQHGTFLLL